MRTTFVLAVALLSAVGSAQTIPPTPLSLQEVQERGIEGILGVPLGTVVEVRGKIIENQAKSKRFAGDPYVLSIVEINGKQLRRDFSSSNLKVPRYKRGFQVGDSFHLFAYETGGFTGIPNDEFKYVESYAGQKFHFETDLVVLKVNEPH
jgi:hypothetical protein